MAFMFSLPPAHSVNRVFLGGRGMLLRFRALTVGWTTYVCMNLAEATRENRRTTETYVVEYCTFFTISVEYGAMPA